MNAKVVLVACLASVAAARPDTPRDGYSYEAPAPKYSAPHASYEKGMPFDFAYGVVDHYSGNDYSHNSNSDGNVVKGEYRVLLPDGRTQIVSYTADHVNGYVAEVTYEGEAHYPETKPYQPAPAYSAPAPAYSPPAPAYSAPAPAYEAPEQTYGTPSPVYGTPH
ncbi:cuticle protein 7-like [Penaeus vannamei]|uniref:cuticle protein 7-like n=1 Tax=Penaeus vannamei TaxID=6689 RepID=UPI000F67A1E2|nr:cuticle protein 19-like [Penaeus vannamei]XP_027237317.1 cuticle protein 19-like [Penaeus vannamei]